MRLRVVSGFRTVESIRMPPLSAEALLLHGTDRSDRRDGAGRGNRSHRPDWSNRNCRRNRGHRSDGRHGTSRFGRRPDRPDGRNRSNRPNRCDRPNWSDRSCRCRRSNGRYRCNGNSRTDQLTFGLCNAGPDRNERDDADL